MNFRITFLVSWNESLEILWWMCDSVNHFAFSLIFPYNIFRSYFLSLNFFRILFTYLSALPTSCSFSLSQIKGKNKNQKKETNKKNNKKKQSSNHTKTKKQTKNMKSIFILVNYSWVWDLPGNSVDISSDTLLENSDFPCPRKNQLQTASW